MTHYEEMLERWRIVSRGMNKVRELYRQGHVSDAGYLAARDFFINADALLTQTETEVQETMTNEQLFSEQANDCVECSEWITKNGRIVGPGKFQGETIATPHAYHVAMEGFVDDTVTFGESATYDRVGNVVLYYSDQGFVYGTVCDDDETAELHMKTLHEQAEQEDEQESDN